MSTVCSVHVRGWAGVGACSAEGVGGPAGSACGRLGVRCWAILFRVAPVFVPPHRGADFRYTNFSGGRNLYFTYTHVSGGWGLHFTYTNFRVTGFWI